MARLGRGQPFKPLIRKAILTASTPTSPSWVNDSPPLTAAVGTAYYYAYYATGAGAPTYTVSSGLLPAGLALDPSTGILSGIPTFVMASTFEVTAANLSGSVTTSSTTIVVSGSSENDLTVSWATIVASGYLYDINLRPEPQTAINIERPTLLQLWVQVVGTLAADPYPTGTLSLSSSPNTGVTVADNNFDGTGNANNIGNGTAAENASSQGQAGFQVTFADAGTFSVSVSFTSTDGNYTNAVISNPLTVTVT